MYKQLALWYHHGTFKATTVMNSDLSIIDAGIVRVAEGLRVLGEIARFILKDPESFQKCAEMRRLAWGAVERGFGKVKNGRSGQDAGRSIAETGQSRYVSLLSIIEHNASRVSESLRTLEEFVRLYDVSLASLFAALRYDMYELEQKLLLQTPHWYLVNYFSHGIVYPITSEVEEAVWFIEHGAKVIQLRDKTSTREVLKTKVEELCAFISEHNQRVKFNKVLFILNDHVDIAAEYPVAGVHIGQDDVSVHAARRMLGSNKIIGLSNHSLDQILLGAVSGADYVSIGPIFATPTKSDYTPVGLRVIESVSKSVDIPWLAIGGINRETAKEVRNQGAKNIAVVRSARQFFS